MPRFRKDPVQRTESIKTFADSEIQISVKEGVKAEGLIAWAALLFFALISFWYLYLKYGDKAKHKVKKVGGRIKKAIRRKR